MLKIAQISTMPLTKMATKFIQPMLLLALLLISNSVTATQISVRTDRNPVNLNESFQLIFSANSDPDGDPDFSVLQSSLDIISQSQNSNISMVNGDFSKTINWTLKVMARQAGVLQIPAVAFGSDHSQALRITVNQNNSQASSASNADLFIQVSASSEQAIVQAQIIYTLRIYRRVNITQANLSEPEPADALVEKLGNDSEFSTQYNGQNYQVIERKYAIFPQKSGPLRIDPVVLTAEVVTNNRRRTFGFFNRSSTRSQRLVSEPLVIDVQPIPANIKTPHWLPAEQVFLEQHWSGDLNQLKPGEPITRTLTLKAKGTTVGQLPELNHNKTLIRSDAGGELKNYPDQPVLKEQKMSDGIIAFREEKTAIIPSQAGVYHLPAIEIPWWDTHSQQMRFARIPATTLTAVGAAPAQNTAIDPSYQDNTLLNETKVKDNNTLSSVWFWLSLIFATGWLITLALWYRSKKRSQTHKTEAQALPTFDDRALKQACREHNPNAAKDALVLWGRQQWQLSNLGKIAQQCQPELQAAILDLNQALYSQQKSNWQGGKQLWSAFKQQMNKKSPTDNKQQPVLQPLYKI